MMGDDVMIETIGHGDVRELRMSRPPVNALNTELIAALRKEIEQASKDGARAVVVSGGQGMFTAGLDVPLLLGYDRAGMAGLWRELYGLMGALASSPIPVAAAMTGHAPAGGTVIAIFCDWRVAARGDFKLGLTEVQVGIPLPPVILSALRRQVGPREAERLGVAGLMLSPEEALRVGMVDELVAPEEVVERAVAWCQTLLALPAEAMLETRRRARADLMALFERGFEEEMSGVLDSWWSPQTQAALHAMVKKMGKPAS